MMMVRSEPTLEAFSNAVEAIYDCALNLECWREALRTIGELTDSPCMAIGITDHAQQRVVNDIYRGYDPAYMKVYFEKFAANPLLSVGHLKPIGEVYTLTMLIDKEDLLESRFYREWSKPQGLGWPASLIRCQV
jgi:hypothetical protein